MSKDDAEERYRASMRENQANAPKRIRPVEAEIADKDAALDRTRKGSGKLWKLKGKE